MSHNEDTNVWTNSKGHQVPVELISDMDKIIEQTVRSVHDFGLDLMNQVARFRGHTFDDIYGLVELLHEQYGATRGGKKGNVSFTSYDGTIKIEVRIQDFVTFGPELQVAKSLIDEYIAGQSDGVPAPIMALVNHAFQVDKEGNVNRAQLYSLRRLTLPEPDPIWDRAMAAIADSMRILGSKETVQISQRDKQGRFRALPINLANAYETQGPRVRESQS